MKSDTLKTDQKLLTNELNSVAKFTVAIDREDVALEGKNNFVFSGTFVLQGAAVAVVVSVGAKTEIAQLLKRHERGKEEKEDPLYRSITNFAEKLSLIVIAICLLSWLFDLGSVFG